MKKQSIIITGVGPTPVGNPDRVYAPGLRLYAFSRQARNDGFHVIMGEAAFGGKSSNGKDFSKREAIEEGWERRFLPADPEKASAVIREWSLEVEATALVATTDFMCRACALSGAGLPMWLDFNGHPMVERQEISRVYHSDLGLLDQWLYILPALLAGDHFSTCSTPQKFTLMGELGAVGRLNQFTSGHDLVTVLAPGPVLHEPEPDGRYAFRDDVDLKNAFCLLWNGGFNTWVDEETLFLGVESAMKENPRIRFIITGGEIKGHDEKTFTRFQERVNASPMKERFRFYGWVPMRDLPNFYNEADAAVNIDRFSYEALTGCRNRVFSWMHFEIPVLTTPLSEITKTLVKRKLASGFTPHDPESLKTLLLDAAGNTKPYREMARRAKEFLHEEYRYEKLLRPLSQWMKNPRRAPDLIIESLHPGNSLAEAALSLTTGADMIGELGRELEEAKRRLARIEGSRAWKLIQKIKSLLGR